MAESAVLRTLRRRSTHHNTHAHTKQRHAMGASKFAEIARAKLASKDPYDKGDVGPAVFQAWYAVAVQYAKGELGGGAKELATATIAALQELLNSTVLLSPQTDEYVSKAMLGNFREVLQIFVIKPKFEAVLGVSDGASLLRWLKTDALPTASRGACNTMVPAAARVEFTRSLVSIVEVSNNHLRKTPTDLPIYPDADAIVMLAINTDADQLLRTEALELLRAMVQAQRAAVVRGLATHGRDLMVLDPMWSLGAANDGPATEALYARIQKTPAGKKFTLELLSSMLQAFASHDIETKKHRRVVLRILRLADGILESEYQEAENNVVERPTALLQCMNRFLADEPNDQEILNMLLEKVSVESLQTASANTSLYSESTWMTVLLPFLDSRMQKMQLQGVSGSQIEQEYIDFVREGARIFYINGDVRPSPSLGQKLFSTIIEAMRHGYIETERFPTVAALVVATHFDHSSADWLHPVLADAVCHNHKTTRAIGEMIRYLLNLSDTTVTDVMGITVSRTQLEHVQVVLAATHTVPAYAVLADLCVSHSLFFVDNQNFVYWTLLGVQRCLDGMAADAHVDVALVAAIIGYLQVLIPRVAPPNAALLFDLAIKSAVMSPKMAGKYSDPVLCQVLLKMPADVALALPAEAVSQALSISGQETRFVLASIVPHMCLFDQDTGVRAQAMRVLSRRPDLLSVCSDLILAACTVDDQHPDSDIGRDHEITLAAAPLVSSLAIDHAPSLPVCMEILVQGVKVSIENDTQDRPDPALVDALNRIPGDANVDALVRFAQSEAGLALLPFLQRFQAWRTFTETCMDTGLLRAGQKTGTFAAGSASGQGASVPMRVFGDSENLAAGCLALVQTRDFLGALRSAHRVRVRAPDAYTRDLAKVVQDQILPSIGETLPTPTMLANGQPSFSGPDLERFDEAMNTLLTVQSLFPVEGEAILRIQMRMEHLNFAKVQQFLDRNDPQGARQWLRAKQIALPSLFDYIDRFEQSSRAGAGAAQNPVFDYVQPSAPPMTASGRFEPVSAAAGDWDAWTAIEDMQEFDSLVPGAPSAPNGGKGKKYAGGSTSSGGKRGRKMGNPLSKFWKKK